MTVYVSDASIFILIIRHQLVQAFFNFTKQVLTSNLVWEELNAEQKLYLSPYCSSGQLCIEYLQQIDLSQFSNRLSAADCSMILLAVNRNGILLTNDRLMKSNAQKQSIEVHGFLWIIEQLYRTAYLSKIEVIQHLDRCKLDPFVHRNQELMNAIHRLISTLN